APLLDRLEVIPLSGYTEEEKVQISIRHLIPKEAEENGLKEKAPFFSEEAIREIIRGYTKEAGLRNLKRQISSILRKLTANYVRKGARFLSR
ncbi:MAG: endopeptidase La, partial [Deltaproteobacteria bacterium]